MTTTHRPMWIVRGEARTRCDKEKIRLGNEPKACLASTFNAGTSLCLTMQCPNDLSTVPYKESWSSDENTKQKLPWSTCS